MTIPSTRQPSVLITLYNFTLWVARYDAENGKEGHYLGKIGRWKRAWRTHTCLDLSLEITWGQYSEEIQCIGIVCNCIGNGGRVKKLQRMEVPRFNLPGTLTEIKAVWYNGIRSKEATIARAWILISKSILFVLYLLILFTVLHSWCSNMARGPSGG